MDEESSSESQSKIPTPLYYSSLCGFSDLVEHLSTKHPQQVNAIGGKYKFPLLAALIEKQTKVAEILLEYGANVNVRGLRKRTPLHKAIYNVGIVQSLLNKGADINCRQDDLRTPLHLAAQCGELEVARVLIEHKADVDSQDREGKTPLYLLPLDDSDRNDNISILELEQLLLECCTDRNIQTTDGWTLLHAAADRGRLDVAMPLLYFGSTNPNAGNEQGSTPLHLVSQGKYNSKEHGVDVNAREKHSWTPLHLAAFKGRVEIAQVLLDHGANVKLETEDGGTALHIVSRGEYDSEEHGVGIARLLLEHGTDVHAQDKYLNTALHSAALCGNQEITRLLLSHGANPNVEREQGSTPLHQVSRGKYKSKEHGVRIVHLLLERGVDVDAWAKDKATPLHWAAFFGKLEIIQVRLF